MISLVFLVLVFSGPGFSNFVIFQGHKSPRQTLCCAQTGSAPPFTVWQPTLTELRRPEAEGKRKIYLANLLPIWETRFPSSVRQGNKGLQQRVAFKNGAEGWLGVLALRKVWEGKSHPPRLFPKAFTRYPDSFPINKTPMITVML